MQYDSIVYHFSHELNGKYIDLMYSSNLLCVLWLWTIGHPAILMHIELEKCYWLCLVVLDSCFGKDSDNIESFEELFMIYRSEWRAVLLVRVWYVQ